jgi:hypothetical protein
MADKADLEDMQIKGYFYWEEKMENLEKYGVISIKSGNFANEVVEVLINAGFEVSKESFDKTHTQYEVFKKKQ